MKYTVFEAAFNRTELNEEKGTEPPLIITVNVESDLLWILMVKPYVEFK
jgi:hypothetical protein